MKLPNGEAAVIPMEKLTGYCLNPNHPSGKHKARVFASALGITAENAGDLQELIAEAAIEGEVIQQDRTEFGQLYKVDWTIPGQVPIVLRTLWELTTAQSNPRLVSAFIR
ncbi:hypothetical protein IQ241_14320 [Romeria aff. gracilis LEGE 07310]|uniref:DUF6883 domain-containing protein n=1 Tax=Vasconcelosia minhoensis LEGE 07310 TaxID=915328 RepID=A0A8J7DC25_9CYAN|nr:DUF6883 domain-containing protein [Romeria gracilis]MBE9078457.1 hypothetical protein [Romeria aff. gracilis LEGE 07310]